MDDDVAIETLSQVWYRSLYFPVAGTPGKTADKSLARSK
jgi:hypothetical protein